MNYKTNKLCKYRYLIFLFLGLNSCFSEEYEYIGEIKVVNKENWRVKIYQLDEFEMLTPVRYEIVDKDDNLISERHRLTSADANLQSVDKFYAKVQDSIFYICYYYPEVVVIKHITNLNGPNQWDLIKRLQKHDASLFLFDAHVIYEN